MELSPSKIHSAICKGAQVVAATLIWSTFSYGQALPQPAHSQAERAEAKAKIHSGQFEGASVEVLAQSGAVEAIPDLKEQFATKVDTLTKAKLANALVRLGNKEDLYWNFLVAQATLAAESPFPWVLDGVGNIVPGSLSPEYSSWAKANNEPLDPVYQLPGRILMLADTNDPRGIPILRKALLSRDFFVQSMAARGLASLRDKASIPLIIEACHRSTAQGAEFIATSLVYFDETEAQQAVDTDVSRGTARLFVTREGPAQRHSSLSSVRVEHEVTVFAAKRSRRESM